MPMIALTKQRHHSKCFAKMSDKENHVQNQQISWDNVWNLFEVHNKVSNLTLLFVIIVNFQGSSPNFACNIKQI